MIPERPRGPRWRLYVCVNAKHATYLKEGERYWLRPARNGWLEDVGCSHFAGFRFELDPDQP